MWHLSTNFATSHFRLSQLKRRLTKSMVICFPEWRVKPPAYNSQTRNSWSLWPKERYPSECSRWLHGLYHPSIMPIPCRNMDTTCAHPSKVTNHGDHPKWGWTHVYLMYWRRGSWLPPCVITWKYNPRGIQPSDHVVHSTFFGSICIKEPHGQYRSNSCSKR